MSIDLSDISLVVFDMDGTLTTTKSGAKFCKTPDDWQLLPGRLETCQQLAAQGIKMGIATNQGGVAFGYLDAREMVNEIERVAEVLSLPMTHVQVCFSHPKGTIERYCEESPRRKPRPGMLLEILNATGVRAAHALMVGDREEDKQAAANCGMKFVSAQEFFEEEDATTRNLF